jgi:hypothetical protein
MSSVTKPVSASTSPIAPSRSGGSTRQVSSQYGAVSELFAQTGVKGEGQQPGFEDFGHGGGRNHSHEQPHTLKLHGTSRTFAMLFEEANTEQTSLGDNFFGEEGAPTGKPAFQSYMNHATSVYEQSTQSIITRGKIRGNSLNLAL